MLSLGESEVPGLRFASLGSGSEGNGTLFCGGSTVVLVDCGFSVRETISRVKRLNIDPDNIDGIFVTHEHGDHSRGVSKLSERLRCPVYATVGTSQKVFRDDPDHRWLRYLTPDAAVKVGDLEVLPVPVPHDTNEPTQFVVRRGELRAGLLTDLGHITIHVHRQYSQCDALFIESNHDPEMLRNGDYPSHVKQRVASDYGHLSNEQTMAFVADLLTERLRHVVIGHISKNNNDADMVTEKFSRFEPHLETLLFATQDEGTGWIGVT